MNIRNLFAVIVAFFINTNMWAWAQEEGEVITNDVTSELILGGEVSAVTYNRYHTDDGHVWHDERVGQLDLWIDIKGGFWIDLWGSVATEGRHDGENFGDEIDFGVGKTTEVTLSDEAIANIDIGLYYFDIAEVTKFNGDTDAWRIHMEATGEGCLAIEDVLKPFVKVQAYKASTESWDSLIFVGVKGDYGITDKLSLDARAYTMYDSGLWDNVSGYLVGAEIAAHYALFEDLTADISVGHTDPMSSGDYRSEQTTWGFGLTYSF